MGPARTAEPCASILIDAEEPTLHWRGASTPVDGLISPANAGDGVAAVKFLHRIVPDYGPEG